MADYSDPLGLLFGGMDWMNPAQKSQGLLQLTPQEIERMAAAQSPAFGVFPQMQPYRSQQDITASANVPVDVVRGRIAGTRGLFGDVVNQPIPMVRPLQLLSQAMTGQQKYPDTEYFLENLPLKSDTPVGDVAGRVASFAPINPMPAVRGVQKLGGLLGEEVATRLSTGKPILPSLLAEPQTAMFAVNPAEQTMTSGLLQAEVSPLGFYSAVEQQALKIPRKQGTGESFLNDLLKGQDVKKYEIEAMGLDTYLKGKPNVTRQEVQDFIQNNKISVEERQLGGTVGQDPIGIAKRKEIFDKYEPQIQAMYKEIDNPAYKLVDRQVTPEEKTRGIVLQNRVFRGETITPQEQAELDSIMTRFNGIAVKEFPNVEEARKFYYAMSEEDKYRHSIMPLSNRTELQQKINELQYIRDTEANAAYVVPEPTPTKYSQFQLAGGENYRELLLTLPEKTPKTLPEGYSLQSMANGNFTLVSPDNIGTIIYAKSKDDAMEEAIRRFTRKEEPYRSSHFPDPNILAHMRVNDRVDAEGKKMLLIEEVQSDWHQAGRERGYGPKIERIVEAYYETKDGQRVPIGYGRTKEEAEANIDVGWKNTVDIKYETSDRKVGEGVPDAPFKDTWYQLALKRAIKEAVDKGYDRIGLTTGKRQIERYTNQLRQNVDEITYQTGQKLTDSEAAELQALRQKSLRDMTITERARFDDLFSQEGDYVAKDETKIKAFKGSTQTFNGIVKNGKFIEGPDQAIGKTIEEVLGKSIAKQILENKTGTVKDKNLTVGGEGMKKYYDEVYPNYLEKYGKKYGAKVGETKVNTVRERAENSMIPSMGQEPVRYLDITPEMKKAVQKGQPLASVEGMTGLLA